MIHGGLARNLTGRLELFGSKVNKIIFASNRDYVSRAGLLMINRILAGVYVPRRLNDIFPLTFHSIPILTTTFELVFDVKLRLLPDAASFRAG